MSNLTKSLAGAYDFVKCIKAIGVKYCSDDTVGQKPMLDFFDNKISVDTPIINDMNSTISLGPRPDVVGELVEDDVFKEELKIKTLFVRGARGRHVNVPISD